MGGAGLCTNGNIRYWSSMMMVVVGGVGERLMIAMVMVTLLQVGKCVWIRMCDLLA